jgi:hypothetical protein
MHRMRRFAAIFALIAGSMALASSSASASLLKPGAKRAYPDIAADINGKVTYNYDEATGTGVFEVTNTPYLIAGSNSSSSEFAILPNADGIRKQTFRISVDSTGKIIDDPANFYQMVGTINAGGETYSGVLLEGKPTDFGFLDLGSVVASGDSTGILQSLGVDIFDANIAISGGALKEFFGDEAYMRITPELESTFNGSFSEDFTALKATSNTRSYDSPNPFPVPEPTTIMVLLAGGVGVLYRHGRQARRKAA